MAHRLGTPGRSVRVGFVRLGFGIATISFTLTQIFYFRFTVAAVPHWIPPNQKFWAILTTVAFGLAALAILINRQAQLALRLLALMTGLFGALVWVPTLFAHPKSHSNWSEFALTLLITGAAWQVADACWGPPVAYPIRKG